MEAEAERAKAADLEGRLKELKAATKVRCSSHAIHVTAIAFSSIRFLAAARRVC